MQNRNTEKSRSKISRPKAPVKSGRTSERTARSVKATPEDAFAAARALLIKGRKLDMVALASQLGVGRATLYRWTGDREKLINDVLATFLTESFDWLDKRTAEKRLRGAERIATDVEQMMRVLTQSKVVRGLLKNEPDVALRILTSAGPGTLHAKSIERLISIVERERARGYRPRLEPQLLAFATSRLVESYVYGGTIAGMKVDLDEASQVIRSLL